MLFFLIMLKKPFLLFSIFILSFFFYNYTYFNSGLLVSAEQKVCEWEDCINSSNFEINVDSFTPWWNSLKWSSAKKTITNTLLTIIEKLMVAFWVLSLFIMTIGWWYMIFYHWQDELLSKWKNIFSVWLIALVIALSSWLLVRLVSYFLYG